MVRVTGLVDAVGWVCSLSSHWEDTYSMVGLSLVVYKEVEGFSFQPSYYGGFASA